MSQKPKTMRIRELRKRKNLSQAGLAILMGVSVYIIRAWEAEVYLPRARELPKLAEVLGCSVDELYAEDGDAA